MPAGSHMVGPIVPVPAYTQDVRQRSADLATADGHDRYVPSPTRDIVSAGHEGVYEWAAEHLVRDGTRFLDLGCGTGYGARPVVARGGIYDGIDGSSRAIEHASAHYGAAGVRFFAGDVM